MMSDEDREHARMQLQAIWAKIHRLRVTVAEVRAQRRTTTPQIAAMDHLLIIFESLRTMYLEVIEVFERGRPERAQALLDELEAFSTRLRQKLEPP